MGATVRKRESRSSSGLSADELVRLYQLQPHPEGGYYREPYRSAGIIPGSALPRHGGDRCCFTSCYFLLPKGTKSSLHRIKSDEVWHFYLGGPLTLVQIHLDGAVEKPVLGPDVRAGQKVHHVVPAGCWFGAYPNPGTDFSFVGLTVIPGFEFADLELGKREELLRQFPAAREIIKALT